MIRRLVLSVLVLASVAANAFAFGDGTGFVPGDCRLGDNASPGSGGVVVVDQGGNGDATTIQGGVDLAAANGTVLVKPGIYKESVVVTKPGLRIRGTDRGGVVLDGESSRQYGIAARADRVVLENMTGHNYTGTAFYWVSATGYWGRHLTAYNNQGYGIYAYDARCGQIDHSFGSGNADSAFYIGECYPCDAVIEHIEASHNALGYSGTNAGGGLTLRHSSWHDNGLGIVPNTLNSEARPPQRGITIAYNSVVTNNNRTAPGGGIAGAYFGGGIVIAAGHGNQVFGNTVTDHELGGIVLSPIQTDPNPEGGYWPVYVPSGNMVWGNKVSSTFPDSNDLAQGALSGPGNCWADNDHNTSGPPMIETIWDCAMILTPPGGDPRVEVALILGAIGANGRMQSDWKTYPVQTCTTLAAACSASPDENGNSDYSDDGGVDVWLPALGLS